MSTSTKWFFVYLISCRIGILKRWFLRRGEKQSTQSKTSRSKGEANNKLNPQMASTPEVKPGWEASAVTTAPSLASLD